MSAVFSRIFHHHDDVYLVRGERARASKRLGGLFAGLIAPAKHDHPELVKKSTTRYLPKNSTAKLAKTVSKRKLFFVSGATSSSLASATVRVDLFEASQLEELPTSAYATSLSPTAALQFYLDAYEAFNRSSSNSSTLTFTVKVPALLFLEELVERLPFLPRLAQDLFKIVIRTRHFVQIAARQVVRVREPVQEVFLIVGGEFGWEGFQKYTTSLQDLVNARAMEYYSVIRRIPDLWVHLQPRVFGAAYDQVVVENNGLPYCLVVFTKSGFDAAEEVWGGLSGRAKG